jgi:hypothetical protein
MDTNMSQGTMATLGTQGREMREIQILAAAESLPDAALADVSVHVENGDNDDTSCASTITQATFNSSADGRGTFNSFAANQATFNSPAAGFEALAQALSQQRHMATLSTVLEEDPSAAPSPQKTQSRKTKARALPTEQKVNDHPYTVT